MKRTFTLFFAAIMTAMVAMATDFTGSLTIDTQVSGTTPTTSTTKVTVEQASDGTYTMILRDFSFSKQLIGTITLEGMPYTKEGDKIIFSDYTGTGNITEGGKIAGLLGNKVSVTINKGSYMNGDDLHLNLYIPVKYLIINVNVKATFQSDTNTDIKAPQTSQDSDATTIYTLDGQQVNSMTSGKVYIVKTTDGQTKKIIKK